MFSVRVFHITRPLHASGMPQVRPRTSSALRCRWLWLAVWHKLSPCSEGLAVPAVQLLSCTVRGKQSLFTDFVALKLTWDDVINQVFVPPGF